MDPQLLESLRRITASLENLLTAITQKAKQDEEHRAEFREHMKEQQAKWDSRKDEFKLPLISKQSMSGSERAVGMLAVAVFVLATAQIIVVLQTQPQRSGYTRTEQNISDESDREVKEYLRLRDEYDTQLNALQAAGDPDAIIKTAPAKEKLDAQAKKLTEIRDKWKASK
jgi:hypothetical protein